MHDIIVYKMKAFVKEISFPSSKHTYILNITKKVNDAIVKSNVKNGFVVINTKHTTLGIIAPDIS